MILFGTSCETSDFWVDCLEYWWDKAKDSCPGVRRLVIRLDNGPSCASNRTQFLKRMVEFAQRTGLEIRLVYYPPYHSKYNPIERVWGSLERHWNGTLLTDLGVAIRAFKVGNHHPDEDSLIAAPLIGVAAPISWRWKHEGAWDRSGVRVVASWARVDVWCNAPD
jgi:hypothetical protein